MRYLRVGLAIALLLQYVLVLPADAVSPSPDVVISHVIAGETGFSNAEFIALYNNSPADVVMNGYCVWSNSSAANGAIACIQAEANTNVYIKSHNYLTIASSTFSSNHLYTPDTVYQAANKITVGGDSVYLQDPTGNKVDRVTWGQGKLLTGGTLQRIGASDGSGILLDTDSSDPLSDFSVLTTTVFPPNASYDVVTIPDMCPNIEGVQQSLPSGMLQDESGNCQPDSCLNIAGLQASVPAGYDADETGNCSLYDACPNISDVQSEVPSHMTLSTEGLCVWSVSPLMLTELYPNPVGSDTGNEFVEIYNPNDHHVGLDAFVIKVGPNGEKSYAFPEGATIGPKEYVAFSDADMKFTLVNTTSRVMLVGIDGEVYGDSGIYDSAGDGMAWARFDGTWVFTNQPTPGRENLGDEESLDEEIMSVASLAPCAAGKYRHPLTNRCRNIETDAAVLAACDADQYRNPDTGRCRKVTLASVTPCKDGQYRSEETNRCRNITAATALKPCDDNQHRSEETGRCRAMKVTAVPESAFAVQPIKEGATAFIGWWALGGIGILAVGYGAWEWRKEITTALSGATSFFSGKK